MSLRTFWIIFIKIMGIWLLLDCISIVYQSFTTIFYPGINSMEEGYTMAAIMVIVTAGLYFFILKLFVFNADWLVDKLKLDQKFTEDRIDLNISRATVLTVAVIVIGGLTFINTFPMLCKYIFESLKEKATFREDYNSKWIIYYFVKTLVGYLLMTNSRAVVGFIERGKAKSAAESEEGSGHQ